MSAAAPAPAPTPEERAALVDQIVNGITDIAASQAQLDELAPERSSPAEADASIVAARELEAAVGDLQAAINAAAAAAAAKELELRSLRDRIADLRQRRDLAAMDLAARIPPEPRL